MTTRTIVAAVLTALVAPLVLLLTATPALACSCVPREFAAQVAGAEVVFAGRVVATEGPSGPVVSSADTMTTSFAVDTVHTGDVAAVVEVRSERFEASCGVGFAPGTAYLVVGTREDGAVRTGLCTGTQRLAAVPAADLALLGEGRPIAPPAPAPAPAAGGNEAVVPAIALGLVVLGVLAAVGWWISRLVRHR